MTKQATPVLSDEPLPPKEAARPEGTGLGAPGLWQTLEHAHRGRLRARRSASRPDRHSEVLAVLLGSAPASPFPSTRSRHVLKGIAEGVPASLSSTEQSPGLRGRHALLFDSPS